MIKLELKSSHEVIDTVDVADVESIFYCKPTDPDILTVLMKDGKRLYCDEVCTLQEETQNDDLEEASNNTLDKILEKYDIVNIKSCLEMFRLGTEWQKKHLWKDAQGDDLPEIDREVIAILDNGKVVFGHRPYKGKYIGKNLITGNIETLENQTFDEGGWNQPNVKWWLDIEKLPNMEERV